MTVFITYDELKNSSFEKLENRQRVLIGHHICEGVSKLLQQEIPDEEIWLYHPGLREKPQQLSFAELLLDERYAEGYLNIPVAALKKCGYLNGRLREKQSYEFLLRLAEVYSVVGLHYSETGEETQWQEEELSAEKLFHEYQADCYILGKYSSLLQEMGYFNEVAAELLLRASAAENQEDWIAWLEAMLGRKEAYWYLADATAPILIYYGVTYCYNILNVMLEQFGTALERAGERVVYYDEQREEVVGLSRYIGQRWKAVVGAQTYLMSVYMKEYGMFLHDRIIGPKFNFVLDHPIWLKEQLVSVPKNYYVLTHDANYKKFIEQYYPNVRAAYVFPPGGKKQEWCADERTYNISFIGTYGDYRKKCEVIRQCTPQIKYRANRFLLYMRKNPELTAEQAFQKMLSYYGIELEREAFLQAFFEMRSVIQCVMYYYREKVIETLLQAGILVDIWGSSWKQFRLSGHSCLRIHEDISPDESLRILRQSKISLNVMAWHKGGFTERMANSMLSGTVLLTDETTYQKFEGRTDNYCVMFSLKDLGNLPRLVQRFLEDGEWRTGVAKRGYAYAKTYHTWDCRAKELLALIEQIERERVRLSGWGEEG